MELRVAECLLVVVVEDPQDRCCVWMMEKSGGLGNYLSSKLVMRDQERHDVSVETIRTGGSPRAP